MRRRRISSVALSSIWPTACSTIGSPRSGCSQQQGGFEVELAGEVGEGRRQILFAGGGQLLLEAFGEDQPLAVERGDLGAGAARQLLHLEGGGLQVARRVVDRDRQLGVVAVELLVFEDHRPEAHFGARHHGGFGDPLAVGEGAVFARQVLDRAGSRRRSAAAARGSARPRPSAAPRRSSRGRPACFRRGASTKICSRPPISPRRQYWTSVDVAPADREAEDSLKLTRDSVIVGDTSPRHGLEYTVWRMAAFSQVLKSYGTHRFQGATLYPLGPVESSRSSAAKLPREVGPRAALPAPALAAAGALS